MNTHQQGDLPDLLSIDEVCHRTGLGRSKVNQLIKEGALDAVRLGHRTTRVTATSFVAFIGRLSATPPKGEAS